MAATAATARSQPSSALGRLDPSSGHGDPGKPLKRIADMGPLREAGDRFDPLVAAAALALNLLGLAMPLAVLQIYDKIGSAQALETLWFLGLGLVLVALAEFALRLAQSYTLALEAQRLGHRITVDAVERQLTQPLGRRGRGSSPAIAMEKFRALDAITAYVSGDHRRDLIDLPFSCVFLLAIFLIGGSLVLVPIGVILLAMAAAYVLLKRNRSLAAQREGGARRRADFLVEFFSGANTVRGLGAEPSMLRRFERLAGGSAKVFKDSAVASNDLQIAVSFFSALGVVSMITIGVLYVIYFDLTPGGLAACALLSSRAIQPLVRSVGAVAERHRALIAADVARSLFDAPRSEAMAVRMRAGTQTAGAASVEANGLVLREPGADGADGSDAGVIVDEGQLRLPAGALALLSAPSQGDATALFETLAGLRAPDEGECLIDGVPAERARRMQGRVVWVTPESRMFRGTIMENLTLFGAAVDSADALAALEMFGLDAVVGALPAGVDTVVHQGASENLAQTHLRLLCLARAAAQKPGLLLLDQPHLYLDDAASQRMFQALRALSGEMTIVIRCDRAKAAAIADHHIELRSGWLACG
ncbi:MAG: ABC transporter ATP-binding protein, partial [Pseudomonadota bacterium]